ncbi:MAG: LysM peptidoglycan-binding domain-containing protein [Lentisphaeria bacterium]|nr:LysM peptidoglycan-binding domain-containing protein [Lentisphaeria bacterium]
MTKKWINIAVACGIAVTFATSCKSTTSKPPKPAGARRILDNRDLVPQPYSSPDALRGITPARPNATAPVPPGNLAYNDSGMQQPQIPAAQPFIPPQQDVVGDQVPVSNTNTISSLFPKLENADDVPAVPAPPSKGASNTKQVSMSTRGTPQGPAKPTVFESPKKHPVSPKAHPAPAASKRTVTVVSGDTLSGIAFKYGVKTDDLAAVNGINKNDVLKVGKVLALPEGALLTPKALPPKQHSSSSTGTKKASATPAAPGAATATPKEGTYVVQANDSLWSIAHKYHVSFADIQKWNPEAASKALQPGQVINIKAPNGKAATAPQATAQPPKAADKPATAANNTPGTPAPAPKTATTAVKEPTPIGGLPPQTSTKDAGGEDKGVIPYTIKDENDKLSILAEMYGTTVEAIKKQNPSIQSDDDLKPGMKIDIPYTLLKP